MQQFRTERWGRGQVCLAPPRQPYSLPGPGLSCEQISGNRRQSRNRGRRDPLPLCATLTYLLLLFCMWTVSLTQGAPAWAWSLAVLSSSESCRRDRHLNLQVETPVLMEMLIPRWEGPCHWQDRISGRDQEPNLLFCVIYCITVGTPNSPLLTEEPLRHRRLRY